MSDGAWSPIEPPYDPAVDGPTPVDAAFMDDPFSDPGPHEPTAAARESGQQVKPTSQRREPTQSAQLVEMAKKLYRMVKSKEGKVYAVKHDQPGIALPLKGSAGGLRQQLSTLYYTEKKRVASSTALQEMLSVLEGDAMAATEEPVFLRFADDGKGTLYIDLGTPSGETVVITSQEWRVVESSPVLFRRTGLISPMPSPQRGGSLDGLRKLINIPEQGFRLLVGWMIAACIPDIPHPFLALLGQQGTAKTTALKMLIQLISPSPAPTGTVPDSADHWAATAYNAPVIGLDNVSNLRPWFQDALCKAVTGDGYIKRENYSDSDITVLHYKRVIAMTSIDPGSLQGDVSDRMLQVELEPIPKTGRRTDQDVNNEFESVRTSVHGALLDLLVQVIQVLPTIHLVEMPRMADFARVLAALDHVTNWSTLPDYLKSTTSAAVDVIEGNQFATAIRDLVEECGVWTGTTTELLAKVSPAMPPRNWPKTASSASGALTRNTPALATIGISIDSRRTSSARLYTIKKSSIPLCNSCNSRISQSLLDQGIKTHPGCAEPTELFEQE
ncbi:hypothetical protein [Arthrobacter sp. HLT1-20]